MKKFISLLLAALMALSLVACGNDTNADDTNADTNNDTAADTKVETEAYNAKVQALENADAGQVERIAALEAKFGEGDGSVFPGFQYSG